MLKSFSADYIERSDKESDQVIAEETLVFLNQPIEYLKKNKNEFIYVESGLWEEIGVDAVSLEVDDVFGTYDVMLGLKLQRKYEATLKEHLKDELNGEKAAFDLIFSPDDGLWNLNFALNNVEGFNEEMSIGDAYSLIYEFLSKLVEAVKGKYKG